MACEIGDFHAPWCAGCTHLGRCYCNCRDVHVCASGVLPKNVLRSPRACPLGRCYNTHQAAHYWRTLVLVPTCHCVPRGCYSAGTTVSAVLRASSVHRCLLPRASACHCAPQGTISVGATVPAECAPCVPTGCLITCILYMNLHDY